MNFTSIYQEGKNILDSKILKDRITSGLNEAETRFVNRYRGLGAQKLEELGEIINIAINLSCIPEETLNRFIDEFDKLKLTYLLNN